MFAQSEKGRVICDAAVAFAAEEAVRNLCGAEARKPIALEIMREAAARGLAGTGVAADVGGVGDESRCRSGL